MTMITLPTYTGTRLADWHGGMYTDVYRVASTTIAGEPVNEEWICGAIEELGDDAPELVRELKQYLGEDSFREAIRDAAARAFFVDDWAFWEEQEGDGIPMGVELLSYAPDTTDHALAHAMKFIDKIERENNKTIDELFAEACQADEEEPTPRLARDFGHYLAMEGMGHGVSWFDNHAHFDIEVPYMEYYS